jgi:hypothetical protein
MNKNHQQPLSAKLNGFELWTHYCFPAFCALPCVLFLFSKATGRDSFRTNDNGMLIFAIISALAAVSTIWIQTRALRFTAFRTNSDAPANYHVVLKVIRATHWKISKEQEASKIVATVSGFPKTLSWGERVEIRFHDNYVYVNSICGPSSWPSIASWGQNRKNVEFIRQAVMGN